MNATIEATPQAQTVNHSTSQFDNELVNAIRDGKLVQIPWTSLTDSEKRAAHVALFHQWGY